jgi:hypothetical protein
MMALEAIELWVEHVDAGLEKADTAEIPGGGNEFIEEVLLECAARIDFGLVTSAQFLKGFPLFGMDDELLGGKAVFEGVLRAAGFSFFGSRAGAELGVSAIGFDRH